MKFCQTKGKFMELTILMNFHHLCYCQHEFLDITWNPVINIARDFMEFCRWAQKNRFTYITFKFSHHRCTEVRWRHDGIATADKGADWCSILYRIFKHERICKYLRKKRYQFRNIIFSQVNYHHHEQKHWYSIILQEKNTIYVRSPNGLLLILSSNMHSSENATKNIWKIHRWPK